MKTQNDIFLMLSQKQVKEIAWSMMNNIWQGQEIDQRTTEFKTLKELHTIYKQETGVALVEKFKQGYEHQNWMNKL